MILTMMTAKYNSDGAGDGDIFTKSSLTGALPYH